MRQEDEQMEENYTRMVSKADSVDSRTAPANEATRKPKQWVKRLRTMVKTIEAMEDENERSAALYYVVARFYGNRVGSDVLRMIR